MLPILPELRGIDPLICSLSKGWLGKGTVTLKWEPRGIGWTSNFGLT